MEYRRSSIRLEVEHLEDRCTVGTVNVFDVPMFLEVQMPVRRELHALVHAPGALADLWLEQRSILLE